MGRGAIVSLALFILPIAVSLGLLIGLDAVRSNNGQAPLFPPGSNPAPGGFGLGGGGGDKLTSELFCQKATGVTPSTKGQQYTRESRLLLPLTQPLGPAVAEWLGTTLAPT